MFQETTESKSDTDRLRQSSNEAATSSTTTSAGASTSNLATKANIRPHQHNQNDDSPSKTSYSVTKQQMAATALHQHYLNYFNSNIPKEQAKSQRTRGSIFNSHEHQSQMSHPNANQRTNHNRATSNVNNNSAYVYHIPSQVHNNHQLSQPAFPVSNMSRSVPRDESPMAQRIQQQHQHQQQNFHPQQQPPQPHNFHIKSRTQSTGNLYPIPQQFAQIKPTPVNASRLEQQQVQQQQQDRDSEETTTTIKEELENDLQGCKTSELEAISSLERNLPIELSFLIRQQAHCMARMNYLDRQIRELKDAAQAQQQVESNQVSSTSIPNHGHQHRTTSNIVNAATMMAHTKNGNFILSDDSGGEYSRATISDDDELSSLLDQIAKSVRPERGSGSSMISNNYGHLQQQQQRLAASNCGTLLSNQQHHHQQQLQQQQFQQPYAIINPNQLHQQQAVPIFVMGSPIAVAHPPSINSNILPGVHFQPEPRYNQYYEDFYHGNQVNTGMASSMITTLTPGMQRQAQGQHQNGLRSQQFDSSISAIEQLVSQKEKRQIISQLKSADNWLKMRSANLDSSLRSKQQQQQQQQQMTPMSKQASTDAGRLHEVEPQLGDNKQAVAAALSTSTIQVAEDRVIADQAEE